MATVVPQSTVSPALPIRNGKVVVSPPVPVVPPVTVPRPRETPVPYIARPILGNPLPARGVFYPFVPVRTSFREHPVLIVDEAPHVFRPTHLPLVDLPAVYMSPTEKVTRGRVDPLPEERKTPAPVSGPKSTSTEGTPAGTSEAGKALSELGRAIEALPVWEAVRKFLAQLFGGSAATDKALNTQKIPSPPDRRPGWKWTGTQWLLEGASPQDMALAAAHAVAR